MGKLIGSFRFLAFAVSLVGAASADATLVFDANAPSGATGQLLGVHAEFTVTGGNTLIIVFQNTKGTATTAPADALCGLYWDMAGNPVFTGGSIAFNSGSSFVSGNSPVSGNSLMDEWMYNDNGHVVAGGNYRYGFGASGFQGFNKNTDTFHDKFVAPGGPVAGANDDYGLVSASGTSGGGAVDSRIFIRDSVIVTLTTASTISESDIMSVGASWGSDGQTVVPEPASIVALGLGALAFGRRRRISR